MNSEQLKDRTKLFAVAIARFCSSIKEEWLLRTYANQLIRASSSVEANYRAACRAKSGADFINKLKIVEEECDECMFFLELVSELAPDKKNDVNPLLGEADEILAITVASIGTARRNRKNR